MVEKGVFSSPHEGSRESHTRILQTSHITNITRGRMGVSRRGSAPVPEDAPCHICILLLLSPQWLSSYQNETSMKHTVSRVRFSTYWSSHHVVKIRQASHPLQGSEGGRYRCHHCGVWDNANQCSEGNSTITRGP